MRRLLAPALFLAASPAAADYVFDPADLPTGFKCDTDPEADSCDEQRRFEAWFNRYEDQYTLWHDHMLFDTDSYFRDAVALPVASDNEGDEVSDYATTNLVDAVYRIALRRYGAGWAFAVDMVCPADSADSDDCAPKLRMVQFRTKDEIPSETRSRLKDLLPTSPAEAAVEFQAIAKWEEADLRACPGAMRQLLKFPAQRGATFWHPGFVRRLKGGTFVRPDELIVTADGSGVLVRARGMPDPASGRLSVGGGYAIYSQWNGGEGMAWALDMAEVVKPCLKPAPGPTPWDKVIIAESKRN
jgi:hypothetical protein